MPRHFIRLAAASLLCAGGAAHAALAPAGAKPLYGRADCARMLAGTPAAPIDRTADGAALLAALPAPQSPQVARTLAGAGDEVLWWLRRNGKIDFDSVATAFHEANHALDMTLSGCAGGKAVYVFEGRAWPTEIVRGSTPPYPIAAAMLPAAFKSGQPGRYQTYLVQTPATSGNDFTTLLDELNAYVGAAQLEQSLASTPLYASFRKDGVVRFDGAVGGSADMMLYVLCYLKAVRLQHPRAYAGLRDSPLALAHLQRLWSAGERVIAASVPHSTAHGGLIDFPEAALDSIYSDEFIGELDRLGIRHDRRGLVPRP
ncbi:hypothetical protein Q4S45_00960 [Massilia sp. R2A-15]|uniref:hypothetical protein n=1 Tax=Massilia sp. R2A-15 TaxID=3064278 RepID=UPI0027345391|nr:hypothetical protein [Massilia sp. R2A-15]WLI89718.1 hypothetical protein Q4S45_00960 [Massilia sp. R2A-15]